MLDIAYNPPERKWNPGKPWKWILADAVIMGGIAFIASLPQVIPSLPQLYIAIKAFVLAFLLQTVAEMLKNSNKESKE